MHRRELVHSSENHRLSRSYPITIPGRCLLAAVFALLVCLPSAGRAVPADVETLLDAAEAAERKDHLIYPSAGSAMSLYHEVLFLEPENEHALTGLARLAEHYLVKAQTALDADQLLKAESLVSRARMIYPEYPPVETMAHQIALVESARRTRETLDWQLIAERSERLTPTLLRLGGIAKAGDCRVTINVSNDAEGRWVFQKMNAAAGDSRVRARVKIASPAAVDILCFDHAANAD
jgi:hypothetical protein